MEPDASRKGSELLLLAAVSVGFVAVLLPLFGAVIWAVCLAVLFDGLNRGLAGRLRLRPNGAAALTTTLVLLLVILPAVVVGGFVVEEGGALIQRLRAGEFDPAADYRQLVARLPRWLADLMARAGFNNLPSLLEKLRQSGSANAQPIAARLWSWGSDTLDVAVNFVVMLYLLFFLLRDGRALLARVRHALPLDNRVQQPLFDTFGAVVRSTIRGNVIVAALQGALGGAALMMVGIPAAVLWAVVMAFLSLLPAVGAALVWGPVAVYLLATGQVAAGVSLLLFGALVIGLVDNLLRPMLVGKEARLPDFVVLVTTIGGISVFGLNGFVIGPTIAALFVAAWDVAAEGKRRLPVE